jgi:hypothetical protein
MAGSTAIDVERLARVPALLLKAAIVALASLVVFVALPARPLMLHVVQKLGHPGVFGLVAICVIALRRRRPRAEHSALPDYATALITCILLGGLTELLQFLTHRDPAFRDVWLDARGALAALALCAAFDHRTWFARRPRLSRALFGALAVAIAVVILTPLGVSIAAYAHRADRFPVLFTPARDLDFYFLEPDNCGPLVRLHVPAVGNLPSSPALQVPLTRADYSGIEFVEPSPDWRGYHSLVIDLTNPGQSPVTLVLRIDDRADRPPVADRYGEEFTLPPGTRAALRVPFEGLRTPGGRPLRLGSITRLLLFHVAAEDDRKPGSFLLQRITLE